MRTVIVRIVLVVVGLLALPVSALLLDGIDDSGAIILPGAAVGAAVLGALLGRWGLDPDLRVLDRSVAGILWALLGLALGIGAFLLALGSIGS